jgi:hypothetical protein
VAGANPDDLPHDLGCIPRSTALVYGVASGVDAAAEPANAG